MSIKINYSFMMSDIIGQRGITPSEIRAYAGKADSAFQSVQRKRGANMQGWMDLPYNQGAVVDEIAKYAEEVLPGTENFVVLGIGGSALGSIALFNALKHPFYNELTRDERGGPRFYCLDSVDPRRMKALFDVIDPKKTLFNVITKSGSTSETMSQYLIVNDILEKTLGERAKDRIVATTSFSGGNLIKTARRKGYKTFFVPDEVGGRFSVLSPVGLLPASMLGLDIKALLEGAKQMDIRCKNPDLAQNPALLTALLMKKTMEKGASVSVMMPYADSLRFVSDWYAQLWGESLGKKTDRLGNAVHTGQTPVKALGVTDQHSMLQLFAEGPFDKVVTFIRAEDMGADVTIPAGDAQGTEFLSGHTLAGLNNAEQTATEYALAMSGRMNCTVTLPKVDEYHMGELMYFFQMQTAYMGEFLEVNAFDQPGVEESKNAAYAILGRKGYEQKRESMKLAQNEKYTV